MRTFYISCLSFLLLFGVQVGRVKGQILLSLVDQGIVGFPDTVHYGDTIKNLAVKVTNNGILPLTTALIDIDAFFQNTGVVGTLASFSLPLGLIGPGDTVEVPLDPVVITPQNSSQGANIMVIWPESPGTPRDSTSESYYVDPITATQASPASSHIRIYPQPASDVIYFDAGQTGAQPMRLRIYDLQGRQVSAHDHLPTSISTSGWTPGIYFVQFESLEGATDLRKILVR